MKLRLVLDLVQGVIAPQLDGRPVFLGELGSDDPSPVIQALANDLGAEAIGGGL